jgi:hypothetical protein
MRWMDGQKSVLGCKKAASTYEICSEMEKEWNARQRTADEDNVNEDCRGRSSARDQLKHVAKIAQTPPSFALARTQPQSPEIPRFKKVA